MKIHSINSICRRRITSNSLLAWDKSLNISPAAFLTKSLSSEPKNRSALMTLLPSRQQAWSQRSQTSTKRYQWEFLRTCLSSFSVMLSAISISAKFRNNLNFRIVWMNPTIFLIPNKILKNLGIRKSTLKTLLTTLTQMEGQSKSKLIKK